MKKIFASMLTLMIFINTTAFAGTFTGNFLDPFNNDLFEVVAESQYYADFDFDFVTYEKTYNEDYSQAKLDEHTIKYDGTYEKKTVFDFTSTETVDEFYYGIFESAPAAFNDGLTRAGEADGCWIGGLKDINNTVKYDCAGFDYFNYGYNLGLLWEAENDGYTGADIAEREYKTTFTNLMTDGKKYEFNYRINNFNDDGYSLMNANGKTYVIKLKKGVIPTVTYNGKKIAFDQIPVIENGRTLVPLRAIFEAFGATVNWDPATSTVTAAADNTEIKLTVNNTTAYKNGEAITLDVPAKIINGRTLVPVRFVSDCFDVGVEWNADMLRVTLTK